MNSKHKSFDSVEMMRAIRDKMSREIDGMTGEQVLNWYKSRQFNDPRLEAMRARCYDNVGHRSGHGERMPQVNE